MATTSAVFRSIRAPSLCPRLAHRESYTAPPAFLCTADGPVVSARPTFFRSYLLKSGPPCPLFAFLGSGLPKQDVEQRAREIADPILAAEGLELVDVELVNEHGWILRLYIDRPGAKVGLEDCARGSHAVETALDVADLIDHAYSLEVSSPGLNRPLRKPEHFKKARGQKVKVKTYAPIGQPPRKNFSGMLTEVEADTVTVDVEGAGAFRIPMREIAKAHLEYEI